MSKTACLLHIPSSLRSQAGLLMDQQFWLLGCDVRYAGGNMLLELGFEQVRPPADWKAATQYSLMLPGGGCLRLWGFGLWYSLNGILGVFVRRSEFAPRLCQLSQPIWKVEDLPLLRLPQSEQEVHQVWFSLAFAFDWFSNYEAWILQRCGGDYRRQCLLQWTKKRIGAADQLSEIWRGLAEECRSLQVALLPVC